MTFPELKTLDVQALEGILSIKSSQGNLLVKLVSLYNEESPELISQIAEGIKNSDVGQVLSSSHSLKSTSATLGAMTLADYARDLENMSRKDDLTSSAAVLDAIKEEHTRVVADLELLIASL